MLPKRILTNPELYPVQPQHINGERRFYEAFDNTETEISAGWIIRFLQERGKSWAPFSYEEINAFYSRRHKDGFTFNRLVEPEMIPPSAVRAFAGHHDPRIPAGGGWIVKDDNGNYQVTDDFILRCLRSSPAEEIFSASS